MGWKRLIYGLLILIGFALPARSAGTLDIAAIYALTGTAADANAYALQGVRYAVDECNKSGGVLGKQINLLVFDNQSTPIGSTKAARRASAANVVAMVGPDWSSHAISVAKVAQKRRIPMISSLSTNPKVTRIGNYIFRICFTDEFQGRIIAIFARQDLKAATAVILIDVTSDYSLQLAEIFRSHFEQMGGRILMELEYKNNKHLFDQDFRQAAQAETDVVFIPGHDESGWISKQLQDTGFSGFLLGGDGWSTPAFFKKGGSLLKQGFFTAHWSAQLDSKQSRYFVQRYSTPSALPNDNIALGYDTMMLLVDAIRRAKSMDRGKIRNAISQTQSFSGVTGTITFNKYGDPIKSTVLMEIKNGVPHYLRMIEP
jgi:branched-chain amino acid transport system substrate-binding protein